MSVRTCTVLLVLCIGCAAAAPPPSAPPPPAPPALPAPAPAPKADAPASSAPVAGAGGGLRLPVNFQHDGYLANSMLVTKEPNNTGLKPGVHLIYVNGTGVDRLKQGGSTKYPEGTVFVDDVREFALDDGVYHQGGHEFITTMVRDSKTYASTGGWGFQAWLGGDPTKPIVTDPVKQCFECHMQRASGNNYVFSTYLP